MIATDSTILLSLAKWPEFMNALISMRIWVHFINTSSAPKRMDDGSQHLELDEMWKKRSSARAPLNFFSDNWSNSYLIRRLIRRDLDSRFRGPWLGYLWAIIEPLLLALVYSFVFGLIVGKADKTYPAVVMVGVICWSLFARSWTTTTKTLSSNASMFQFTKIPKSVFAVSSMLTNYILSLVSLFALIPFIILYDISIGWSILLAPFYLLIVGLTGMSLGLLLAPVAARVPDIVNLVNFLARVGFFLSPVMWTYEMLSTKFGDGVFLVIAHLNPVIVPITLMRDSILGTSASIPDYGFIMTACFIVASYVIGTMVFQSKAHKVVAGL